MAEIEQARPTRRNIIGFVALTLSVATGVALYTFVRYRQHAEPAPGEHAATRSLGAVREAPHVFIRSARRDAYGQINATSLDPADAAYAPTTLTCERFAFAADRGICLVDNRINLTPPAKALIVGPDLQELFSVDLAGIPSRARVSSDGRYAVATVFTSGDDYEAEFSTRTNLIDAQSGQVLADLEQFAVIRDKRVTSEVDFNFWGVTFKRDSNEFYATLMTKGTTYLVEGNVAARQMTVLRENVECPSLSPDQSKLVFKSKRPGSRGWRLHALELATGAEWPLESEQRSVDDQVEWLDDERVLYRILEERGLPEQALNIWQAPVAKGTQVAPLLFQKGASSPSVQRR